MKHASLAAQTGSLLACVRQNPEVYGVLERVASLGLPGVYVGAGCIAQSVWNVLWDHPPGSFLKDIDIVYFDPDEEGDAHVSRVCDALSGQVSVPLDVTNQAYVHRWYPEHFGREIEPFASTEEAISTWPTTASAVGLRLEEDGSATVCAPFGLHDVLGGIVRPNKAVITRATYERKVERWRACWPQLEVIPW